jgi:hypothetical protein
LKYRKVIVTPERMRNARRVPEPGRAIRNMRIKAMTIPVVIAPRTELSGFINRALPE